jgi:MEMO1 family protein
MAGTASVAGGVRPAAVAGLFYPADPGELREEVARFLEVAAESAGSAGSSGSGSSGPSGSADSADSAAESAGDSAAESAAQPSGDPPVVEAPKAVIAPHAGYRYSGLTAGHAYNALAPRRGSVSRVVVVGPAHRVRVAGVGLSTARAWATPLGHMEIDAAACCELEEMAGVVVADDAHAPEHSIEVHLPFVHAVFGEVPLVPLVVGRATAASVAKVLDAVWGGAETAIVVSSR